MRGVIVTELREFVVRQYGAAAWHTILKDADLTRKKMYVETSTYADSELERLVQAACRNTGIKRDELLEEFGESLAVGLLTTYKSMVKPEWTAEDVLVNAEHAIHQVVRVKHPDADPPRLRVKKVRDGEYRLLYRSDRNMLDLAKGIIQGVAKFYGEETVVSRRHHDDAPELHIFFCFERVPKFLQTPQSEAESELILDD